MRQKLGDITETELISGNPIKTGNTMYIFVDILSHSQNSNSSEISDFYGFLSYKTLESTCLRNVIPMISHFEIALAIPFRDMLYKL